MYMYSIQPTYTTVFSTTSIAIPYSYSAQLSCPYRSNQQTERGVVNVELEYSTKGRSNPFKLTPPASNRFLLLKSQTRCTKESVEQRAGFMTRLLHSYMKCIWKASDQLCPVCSGVNPKMVSTSQISREHWVVGLKRRIRDPGQICYSNYRSYRSRTLNQKDIKLLAAYSVKWLPFVSQVG